MRFLKLTALILFLLPLTAAAGSKRQIEATYLATVESIPDSTELLEIWIPLPAETLHQSISALNVESPYPAKLRHDPEFGNAYLYLKAARPAEGKLMVKVRFRAERLEVNNPALVPVVNWNPAPEAFERYLKPDRLVTISPRIWKLTDSITKGLTTSEAKASAIYRYVLNNMTYDKTVPGWGKGDTERACDIKKGNCTDFHSLFISLARASGIPSRFVIGFPLTEATKGTVPGYHCWAEFYLAGHGWVPVDPSEASKTGDSRRREYLFGNLDPDRIEFTIGRDIKLNPAQHGEPLNYFIYPYAEADGKSLPEVKIQLDYFDLPGSSLAASEGTEENKLTE